MGLSPPWTMIFKNPQRRIPEYAFACKGLQEYGSVEMAFRIIVTILVRVLPIHRISICPSCAYFYLDNI